MMAAITWCFVLHFFFSISCIYHLKCAWVAHKDPQILLDVGVQKRSYKIYIRIQLFTRVWIMLILLLGLLTKLYAHLGWKTSDLLEVPKDQEDDPQMTELKLKKRKIQVITIEYMVIVFAGIAYGFIFLAIFYYGCYFYRNCKKQSILDDTIVAFNRQSKTSWKEI